MNNLLTGICMIALGLVLDIYMLLNRKKFNTSWKILIFVTITNVIAIILWAAVPESVMPYSLGGLIQDEGYILDRNVIKDIIVIINSFLGALLCIKVNNNINSKKEKMIKNILSILIIVIMTVFNCGMMRYM